MGGEWLLLHGNEHQDTGKPLVFPPIVIIICNCWRRINIAVFTQLVGVKAEIQQASLVQLVKQANSEVDCQAHDVVTQGAHEFLEDQELTGSCSTLCTRIRTQAAS